MIERMMGELIDRVSTRAKFKQSATILDFDWPASHEHDLGFDLGCDFRHNL